MSIRADNISSLTGTSIQSKDFTTGNLNLANGTNYSGAVNIVAGPTTAGTINIGNGVDSTTNTNIGTSTGVALVRIGSATKRVVIEGAFSNAITIGYTAPGPTQLGYLAGGDFVDTSICDYGIGTYAFPKSVQLPIGTFIFTFNAQIRYISSGSWSNAYAAPYSGLAANALTNVLTPYSIGFTYLMTGSKNDKCIGFTGSVILRVTTANLWYTYGLTYIASATVSNITGSFTCLRVA